MHCGLWSTVCITDIQIQTEEGIKNWVGVNDEIAGRDTITAVWGKAPAENRDRAPGEEVRKEAA